MLLCPHSTLIQRTKLAENKSLLLCSQLSSHLIAWAYKSITSSWKGRETSFPPQLRIHQNSRDSTKKTTLLDVRNHWKKLKVVFPTAISGKITKVRKPFSILSDTPDDMLWLFTCPREMNQSYHWSLSWRLLWGWRKKISCKVKSKNVAKWEMLMRVCI